MDVFTFRFTIFQPPSFEGGGPKGRQGGGKCDRLPNTTQVIGSLTLLRFTDAMSFLVRREKALRCFPYGISTLATNGSGQSILRGSARREPTLSAPFLRFRAELIVRSRWSLA